MTTKKATKEEFLQYIHGEIVKIVLSPPNNISTEALADHIANEAIVLLAPYAVDLEAGIPVEKEAETEAKVEEPTSKTEAKVEEPTSKTEEEIN